MAFGYCPDCLARLDLNCIPKAGQEVTCGGCNAVLKVIDLNPLQIDWAAEAVGDGWEEEWEVELDRVQGSWSRH
jgi:hypothetical protein